MLLTFVYSPRFYASNLFVIITVLCTLSPTINRLLSLLSLLSSAYALLQCRQFLEYSIVPFYLTHKALYDCLDWGVKMGSCRNLMHLPTCDNKHSRGHDKNHGMTPLFIQLFLMAGPSKVPCHSRRICTATPHPYPEPERRGPCRSYQPGPALAHPCPRQ